MIALVVALTVALAALVLAILWGREWQLRCLLAREERDEFADENIRWRRLVRNELREVIERFDRAIEGE